MRDRNFLGRSGQVRLESSFPWVRGLRVVHLLPRLQELKTKAIQTQENHVFQFRHLYIRTTSPLELPFTNQPHAMSHHGQPINSTGDGSSMALSKQSAGPSLERKLSFLDFPYEVRRKIYIYAIPPAKVASAA